MTIKQVLTVTVLTSILAGCGAGPQSVDTEVTQKNTDANKRVRAIFDASGGDFDKVPDTDKKFLIERFKTEKDAREGFELIKHPPGGLPSTPAGTANQ